VAHPHRFRVLPQLQRSIGQRTTLAFKRLSWALAGALFVVLLVATLWFVLDPLPRLLSSNEGLTPKDALNAQNSARTAVVQAVGGMALLVGLVFTARSFRLTREGHITERFSQAIGHLGSDHLTARIGGLYALERIGRDSPHDRRAVRENLIRFITVAVPTCDDQDAEDFHMPSDVEVAIRVLGRRRGIEFESKRLDLAEICLRGMPGDRADWRNADFAFSVLDRALFMDCNCNGAIFHDASLHGASFARSSLRDAFMHRVDARGAFFTRADLRMADLREADLRHALLRGRPRASSWRKDQYVRLNRADVTDANFTGADIDYADFRGAIGLTVGQLLSAEAGEHLRLDPELRAAYERELQADSAAGNKPGDSDGEVADGADGGGGDTP
jgi:hypothetical protein